MKYLKIEDKKGLYWDGQNYQDIDKINKDSLLILLNSAESVGFEMDDYKEEDIGNKAHQIIYENIYSKLKQFLNEKDQFVKEVDNLYVEAINKYDVEIKNDEYKEINDPETTISKDEIKTDDCDCPF